MALPTRVPKHVPNRPDLTRPQPTSLDPPRHEMSRPSGFRAILSPETRVRIPVHRRRLRERRRRRTRARAAGRRVRTTSGSLLVSTCSYTDPSSPACGTIPGPGSCHLRDHGSSEDRRCTPGAIDPRVTEGNIDSTICRPGGYTDSVRPPTSYTDPLKLRLMAAYGLAGRSTSGFELDHLVALELGGAPADPRNLWPEPYAASRGASAKDGLEDRLHGEVCSGAIALAAAQREMVDFARHATPSAASATTTAPSPSPAPGSGGGNCTRGYSPCIPPGSDVDCAGGGGDGPRYVQGPVRVTGSDPYYLDGNGDGVGCE
jgi:hypothetical protein